MAAIRHSATSNRFFPLKEVMLQEASGVANLAQIRLVEPALRDLPDNVLSAWFDRIADLLDWKARSGVLVCCRAMHVPDGGDFLRDAEAGRPLGVHWTHEETAASTSYHDNERFEHEVLLYAEVPLDSIDWRRTILQNFKHPVEREVVVTGPVRLTLVAWGTEAQTCYWTCDTEGDWRAWSPAPAYA